MNLKVILLEGWIDYSRQNPDGPATFLRDLSDVPGALQMSMSLYKSGQVPNPSPDDLIELAKKIGLGLNSGEVVETYSGECALGIFGTAIFRSAEYPRIQIWQMSNGKDFVLATHICGEEPDPKEIEEAQVIVRMVRLGETDSEHTAKHAP